MLIQMTEGVNISRKTVDEWVNGTFFSDGCQVSSSTKQSFRNIRKQSDHPSQSIKHRSKVNKSGMIFK